jgi:hypothetical protein
MRGSRPGTWKQYEASQLNMVAACMTSTKRSTFVPAAAIQVAHRPAAPAATRFFVVGPVVGTLGTGRARRSA